MKLITTLAAVCLSASALGQGVRYDHRVATIATNYPPGAQVPVMAIPNAQVTICIDGNCGTKALIYSNQTLIVPTSNPMQSDGQGHFGFWAAAGTYWYKIVEPSGKVNGIYPITLGGSGGGGTGCTTFGTNTLQMSDGSGGCLTTNSDYNLGGNLSFTFGHTGTPAGFNAFTGGLGFLVQSTTGGIQLNDQTGGIHLSEGTGGIAITQTSGGINIHENSGGINIGDETDSVNILSAGSVVSLSGQGILVTSGGTASPANDIIFTAQDNRYQFTKGSDFSHPTPHGDFDTSLFTPGDAFVYTLPRQSGKLSLIDSSVTAGTGPVCPNGTGGILTTVGCTGSSGSGSVGTAGQLQKVGSTAGSFAASAITDNGTTVTSSEPFIVNDGTLKAGNIGLLAGTAPSAAPANTVQINAPTAVTAYGMNMPGAQPTAGNTFLSCTAANPAVCSWAAGGGSTGFPINLGSTTIASGSTTAAVSGLSVNGVSLTAAGSATTFLNGAGGYTTPAGGGGSFPSGASQLAANDNNNSPATTPNVTYDQSNRLLNVGDLTSLPKGPFVLASFGGAAGSTPSGGAQIAALFVSVSTDGVNWQLISTGFTGISGEGVRDPSIAKIGQLYYVVYTPTTGTYAGTGFGMAVSSDLSHWTAMSHVVISGGSNPMVGFTWAPEFYIENPGCTAASGTDNQGYPCTAAQAVHVIYCDSISGGGQHQIYEIKALNSALTSWGNNAGTANQADLLLAKGTNQDIIDPQIVRFSATQWRLIYINTSTSCTVSGSSSCNIQYATASSLAGTYTIASSGNWTGDIGTAANLAEGQAMYNAGTDASGNIIWRLVLDSPFGSAGLTYIESHDNWTTWQSVGTSGGNWQVSLKPPAGFFASGGFTGTYHHGTVIHPLDMDTARDINLALATQSRTWGSFSSISNGVPSLTTFNFTSGAPLNLAAYQFNDTEAAGAFMHPATYLAPNAGANNHVVQSTGVANSANNVAYVGFVYQSSGSSTNYGTLGMFGADDELTWWPNGSVGVGYNNSTGVPPSKFSVNGTAQATNLIATSFANAPGVQSTGTKFTTSGCSVSSTTGGATAGILTLGANSCTVVITMTGLTANNGWTCQAHDRTAPTILIGGESSSTTTTASIVIPAGAGATDVISFRCVAF